MRKFATLLILSSCAVAVQTYASNDGADPYEGDFTSPKTVTMPTQRDRVSCNEVDGTWKNDACYFNSSDDVSVVRSGEDFDLSVATIGVDRKSCRFEGIGSVHDESILVATTETALGPCDLTIHYAGEDWVSVMASDACRALCENEELSLDILRAKRTDILGP